MSQIDFTTYGSIVFFSFLICSLGYRFFIICCFKWFLPIHQRTAYFVLSLRRISIFTAKKSKNKANDLPISWQTDFQNPASSQMEGIADLYADVMTFLAGIFFFVFIILGTTASHWAKSEDSESSFFIENKYSMYPKDWLYYNYNIFLEIVWTIVPTLILVIIAIPSFSLLFSLEDDLGVSIWVKVIGAQWYWNYEFYEQNTFNTISSYMVPEDDLVFGQLRLLQVDNWLRFDVNTAVKFFVTSQDVLHSWAVPALGVKIDACPGRLNVVTVFMKRSGFFYGQCSEICGINHAFMPILIEVRDEELANYVNALPFFDYNNKDFVLNIIDESDIESNTKI